MTTRNNAITGSPLAAICCLAIASAAFAQTPPCLQSPASFRSQSIPVFPVSGGYGQPELQWRVAYELNNNLPDRTRPVWQAGSWVGSTWVPLSPQPGPFSFDQGTAWANSASGFQAHSTGGGDVWSYKIPQKEHVNLGAWSGNPIPCDGGSNHLEDDKLYWPLGSSLPIDAFAAAIPPSFLPVGDTIEETSLPLVPGGLGGESTSWQGQSRATLNGKVDLATASPIANLVDLELPLGSAKFRLTRSRIQMRSDTAQEGMLRPDPYWDWAGNGWMIGENPLLIVDSRLPQSTFENHRTVNLILDGSHSIPFQMLDTGQYEAPPRFRAILRHNGTFLPNGQMTVPPTRYDIYLFDRKLHYQFVVARSNMPSHDDWSDCHQASPPAPVMASYHEAPLLPSLLPPADENGQFYHTLYRNDCNEGKGIPYLGLCTLIEDQSGNRVEINYVPVQRYSIDDPNTSNGIETFEDSLSLGQINYVKLKTRHTSGNQVTWNTEWTLLYAHRRARGLDFADSEPKWGWTESHKMRDVLEEMHGDTAIERIYVYKGNVDDSLLADANITRRGTPSIHPNGDAQSVFLSGDTGMDGGTDPLTWYNSIHTQQALPTNWEYRVRYHHRTLKVELDQYGDQVRTLDLPSEGEATAPLTLLKTTVERAPSNANNLGNQPVERVFSYVCLGSNELRIPQFKRIGTSTPARFVPLPMSYEATGNPFTRYGLAAVFENDDLSRAVTAGIVDYLHLSQTTLDSTTKIAAFLDEQTSGNLGGFVDYPTVRYLYNASYFAQQSGLGIDISNDSTWANDGYLRPKYGFVRRSGAGPLGPVTSVRMKGSDGVDHRFDVHSYLTGPELGLNQSGSQIPDYPPSWIRIDTLETALQPPFPLITQMSNVFVGPNEAWHAADLAAPRWVTVVDEIPPTVSSSPDDPNTPHPVSVAQRRLTEMNASGIALRHREFAVNCADGHMLAQSGDGLGEEYIFKEVGTLFEFPDPLPDWIPPSVPKELLLVETRSMGWSAARNIQVGFNQSTNFDKTTLGLTTFTDYTLRFSIPTTEPTTPPDWSTLVFRKAEGIKRGTADPAEATGMTPQYAGARLYTKFYFETLATEADPTDKLITLDSLTPTSNANPTAPEIPGTSNYSGPDPNYRATYILTKHTLDLPNYEGEEEEDIPVSSRRATSRTAISPPRRLRPDGTWYYPVEKEFYNSSTGMVEWSGSGLLANPMLPTVDSQDPLDSFILTYYRRDALSRTRFSVLDAAPTTLSLHDTTVDPVIPDWPLDENFDVWCRLPAATSAAPAALALTEFVFNGPEKDPLSDVYYPNGLRWAKRFRLVECAENYYQSRLGFSFAHEEDNPNRPRLQEFVFNELFTASQDLRSASVCEWKFYPTRDLGAPIHVVKGEWADSVDLDEWVTATQVPSNAASPSATDLVAVAAVKYKPDRFGRLQQADLLEPDVNGNMVTLGSKYVNELIDVYREKDVYGNITRETRNLMGQPLRTYAGTSDNEWDALPNGGTGFNMYLKERIEYGTTENNALLPTRTYSYASNPTFAFTNMYSATLPQGTTDSASYAEYSYDWRMRTFRVDQMSSANGSGARSRLSTTLTYLDFTDRVLMTVTFGPDQPGHSFTLPDSLNPAKLLDGQVVSSPTSFYSLSLKPTSIVQNIYEFDESAVEVRTYDMLATSPQYLATKTYRGRGNITVFSQSPSSPVSIATLDGVGRVSAQAQVEPRTGSGTWDRELTRTDYKYDGAGNVIETASWERFLSTGDQLSTSNAVRTRACKWYDSKKRLVAAADLGTESSDFTNSNSSLYSRGTTAPSADIHLDTRTFTVNRAGVPATARLTLQDYNKKDLLLWTVSADGKMTMNEYTKLGRLIKRTEDWGNATASLSRATAYSHSLGRVVEVQFARSNATGSEGFETTRVDYAAKIVDSSFTPVSSDGNMVGLIRYPRPDGTPNPYANPTGPVTWVSLRYNFQGKVAERTDERGITMRYRYDDQERLTSIEVGHYETSNNTSVWVTNYPSQMSCPTGTVVDRIGYVTFEYDQFGNQCLVTAYNSYATALGTPITQSKMECDGRNDLVREWQSIGEIVGSSTPKIDYTWAYSATGTAANALGYHRLTSMTYPAQGTPTPLARRVVNFTYGAANTTDALLSRITAVTSGPTGGFMSNVANFAYSGGNRRTSFNQSSSAIVRTFNSTSNTSPGLTLLDRFGRTVDLHTKTSAGATLHRAELTLDDAGNLLASKLTQVNSSQQAVVNARSAVNAYDTLNRLTQTDVGQLSVNTNGVPYISTLKRSDTWGLDLLGNWANGGLSSTGDLDGTGVGGPNNKYLTFAYNGRNEMTSLDSTSTVSSEIYSGQPSYDQSGNLVYDGRYFYQYDAWNRVVQVNIALSNTPTGSPPDPTPCPDYQFTIGAMVKHYTYDGLGRLVRTQSPFPDPDNSLGQVRSERFYYDGIRRIQEVVVDPVVTIEGAAEGTPEVQQQLNQSVPQEIQQAADPTATPATFEQMQTSAESNPLPPSLMGLQREYVWGTGDGGVDELLVMFDVSRSPYYPIQDAGGDLVALCDVITVNGVRTPRVTAQWTYSAYGECQSYESIQPHPLVTLGHKGLFCDRLDGVTSSTGNADGSPRIVPFAHTVYHNRNRMYAPGIGRFMQRDPNGTAMTLIEGASFHGRGVSALADAFSIETQYGDGGNLYQYLGSNPRMRSDVLGLSWDPFELVDDFKMEMAGNAAGLMSALGNGAKAAAIMAAHIAEWLPFPGAQVVSTMTLYALGEISAEDAMTDLLVGLIPFGKLGQIAKNIGGKMLGMATRIGSAAFQAAKHYAGKAGKFLWQGVKWLVNNTTSLGLMNKAWCWITKNGCFTADTAVWTSRGAIPIADVQVGDYVVTSDEDDVCQNSLHRVVQKFVRRCIPIVVVGLSTNGVLAEVQTTAEHPFFVESRGWVEVQDLQPGEVVQAVEGVTVVEFVRAGVQLETVYNLKVAGAHTYRITRTGFLVHNDCHHLIPKYLLGAFAGTTSKISAAFHHELHRLINEHCAIFGIPAKHEASPAGMAGTFQNIRDWIAAQPSPKEAFDTIKSALRGAYGEFDMIHGTDLLKELEDEIIRQGY